MPDPRTKRIVVYAASAIAAVIVFVLALRWPRGIVFPGHPGRAPVTVQTPEQNNLPSPWRQAYQNAADGEILNAPFTIGRGCVTCSTIGPHGELILGTEDEGLVIYDPGRDPHWRTLNDDDGLADLAVYSLATDSEGRIWIGHGSGGVSVWNGTALQHYPVGEGPLGDRVFSIAVAPDRSVWLATSAGLTRYDESHGWRHYTAANGLPGLQAAKLVFAPNGKLYVATQSNGLAVASADDDYAHFTSIQAVAADQVNEKSGVGLPSNLCNDVAITPQGDIYVATCYGLARSIDDGKTFHYFRGDGMAAQEAPLDDDLAPSEKSTSPVIGAGDLQEDFIATLAADPAGRIVVGYRRQGGDIFKPATADPQAPPQSAGTFDCTEPTSMIVTPGGDILITQTKAGARLLAPENIQPPAFTPMDSAAAPLPSAAAAPSLAELTTLLETARAVPADPHPAPLVVTMADDWTTQGACLGRHGKYFAALAAMVSPSDLIWGTGAAHVKYGVSAGEGALRYYVSTNATQDPSALEMFSIYLDSRVRKNLTTWDVDRREAEWNDFGGGPPRARDGPNVYVGMHVPPGLFIMSLYFHNKDGHSGLNSLRDFDLSVRPSGGSLYDHDNFAQRPELANARVRQFWHGVYKQFLVRGPLDVQIQVGRNHSNIAIVAAAMLDEVDERSTGYFATNEERQMALKNAAAALQKELTNAPRASQRAPSTALEAANALLAELDIAKTMNPLWWGRNSRTFYEALYRFYEHRPAGENPRQAATCCYYLQLFPAWESNLAAAGEPVPRTIEKALRWTGNKDSFPTEDYDLVRKFLKSPTTEKSSAAPEDPPM